MTADQELAALCEEWPDWHIWRGRDGHGQSSGWHATFSGSGRSVIVAADGPAELRLRLQRAARPQGAARP
jgi:hypothetical protein